MRSLASVPTRCVAATPTWTTSSTRRGDAGELAGHDIVATRRVTLDGGAVATHDALEAGAGLLDVALELVAGGGAAALVAILELLELTHGLLAGAERAGDGAGGARRRGRAPRAWRRRRRARRARRRLPCSAVMRAARTLRLGGVARLVGGLRADATTRGARRRRGRGAARGRLALASGGLRLPPACLAAGLVAVVVVVGSWSLRPCGSSPARRFGFLKLCSPQFPANICT